MGMMQILIKFGWEEHQESVKELEALKEELASSTSKEDIKTKFQEIEGRVAKVEKEIKARKQHKFLWDEIDYDSGRILTFHKRYDHLYKKGNNGAETPSTNVLE